MKIPVSMVVLSLVYYVGGAPELRLRGGNLNALNTNVNGTWPSTDSGEQGLSGPGSMRSLALRQPNWGSGVNVSAVASPATVSQPAATLANTNGWVRRASPVASRRHRHLTDAKASAKAHASAGELTDTVRAKASFKTGHSSASATFKSTTKVKVGKRQGTQSLDLSPTPAPTASASPQMTVHITDENDFALLLPTNPNELISDSESEASAYCTLAGCANTLPEGFITAAAVSSANDNSSWIQITGCLDPTKSQLSQTDDGGQYDVRFPNGALCTFGGYGASFIEQVEPAAKRFCLRCCSSANDQTNCNSHQDRAGCLVAVPGIYDFPDKGISCA
ncbi:hypothetical protein M0805_009589 [Coniferiporia weirii]|nr:hypothetical protein M0805_009589 [Coniferiporia weirii]